MTCATSVQLGSLLLDCDTSLSGVVWAWSRVDGWWDSAPVRAALSDQQPDGETITANRRMGRPLVLAGSAFLAGGNGSLDDLVYAAVRTINRTARLLYVPALLKVNEPGLGLQTYVRRTDRVRTKMFGRNLALTFEVPLLAPDPNRYAQTATTDTGLVLTTTSTTVTHSVTNNGDANTPVVITIDGPATNPAVTNNTIATTPTLQWTGVLGGADTLVIDTAAATVLLNGANARASLTTAEWFSLVPGVNSLTYTRTGGSGTTTAQLDYRDAYE